MRIIDEMDKENLDSILILNPINITYLSGFKPSGPSILIVKDEPMLFTSKMDMETAHLNSKIPVEEFKSLDEIKKLLAGTVGIEGSMTLETFQRLKKGSSFQTNITSILERLRRVKSSDELKNIKKAIDISEKSINKIEFKENMTENKLAAQIEYQMRINGSNKAAFDTIIASSTRSSLPHAETSDNPLKNPIVIDWGAVYNNYCSDTTRTIIETEKHEEIFEIVLEAQKKAIDVIKPGIKASYVDKVAREVIEDYGYGNSFIHSTGHSIGLEVHETPSLSKRDKIKLEKGMVITVEPGIYLKDEFGVRIEDMVHIQNKGIVLNKIDKRIYI